MAVAATGIRTARADGQLDPSADVATNTDASKKKEDELQEVVVTGSWIPQARAEVSTPVTVIWAEEIETKGFASVADALQHSSFSTGSVQGGVTPTAPTPSACSVWIRDTPSY